MKAKTPKRPTPKGRTPGVTTSTFEPGCYFEFTEMGAAPRKGSIETPAKKPSNGKVTGEKKTTVATLERRYLKDIEIYLNKCVNLAERLEDKRATKIVQLLRDARMRAVQMRG